MKNNGPRDFVMSVREPLLSMIKTSAKNGWTLVAPGPPPLLLLDLAPSSKSGSASTHIASRSGSAKADRGGTGSASIDSSGEGSGGEDGSSRGGSEPDSSDGEPEKKLRGLRLDPGPTLVSDREGVAAAAALIKGEAGSSEAAAIAPSARPQRRAAAASRLTFLRIAGNGADRGSLGSSRAAAGAGGRKGAASSDDEAERPRERTKRPSDGIKAGTGDASLGGSGAKKKAATMWGTGVDATKIRGVVGGTGGKAPASAEAVAEAAEAEALAAAEAGDDTLLCPWPELFQEVWI